VKVNRRLRESATRAAPRTEGLARAGLLMNDRIRRRTRSILATLALATLAAVPGFAAEELSFRRAAGDFWVYLSVMPAELTQGPRVFEPGATPFQTPAAQNTHYVMVSLFNYRTARRIHRCGR
jgi:hypothetical protein